MRWRFSRRVQVFPGVKINFSTRGVSTTFGIPGASINVGPKGVYANTRIPGTGLHSRTRLDSTPGKHTDPSHPHPSMHSVEPDVYLPQNIGAIKSSDSNSITSQGLRGIKETLLAAYKEKRALKSEADQGRSALSLANKRLNRIKRVPFHKYFFKKKLAEREQESLECNASLEEATRQHHECKVKIDIQVEPPLLSGYQAMRRAFDLLQSSQRCWDITASRLIDKVRTRSYASTEIVRKSVSLRRTHLDFVESEFPAFHFVNTNGADLYLYLAFLAVFQSVNDFGLVDFKDLRILYSSTRFVETNPVPPDASIVGSTWKYVNKDGSRDKRFSHNYQIPIVLYGELHFQSNQGLNEVFQFSNASGAEEFLRAFLAFKQTMYPEPQQQSRQGARSTHTHTPTRGSSRIEALKVFGLPADASQEQIRNMYYEMLKKYHPDKVAHLGQEFQVIAEQKTKEMNLAYATLTSVRWDEPPRESAPNQPNPPSDGSEDDLFSAAVQIVTDMGRASTSVLQRRLSIGYGRASKLLDLMEQCGFVARSQDSGLPRKVTQAAYDYRSRLGK